MTIGHILPVRYNTKLTVGQEVYIYLIVVKNNVIRYINKRIYSNNIRSIICTAYMKGDYYEAD